ncbi:sensor histidine kinase [Caulobacter soli]|uniref:sensor histidine kinase n=1 Tax=Caulobacter soli TaxID=2708539 RepID=UPI0013EB8823|nr:sensor histidine kinase [Caulobacter soli]
MRTALHAAVAAALMAAPMAVAPSADAASLANDYKHVSWSVEGGAPGRINTIGQSRDGYLWLGGVEGLFRFDGVTFEKIESEQPKPARLVVAEVLGARSGDVWVGLARGAGVAVYRQGRLIDARMPNPSREVTGLAEGPDGAIWVARGGRGDHTLARWRNGRWDEIGAETGLPSDRVWHIHVSRDGTLWVVLDKTVVFKRPGAARFEATNEPVTSRASIGETPDGAIWVSDTTSTRPLRPSALPGSSQAFSQLGEVGGARILFDRRGQLWGTTWTDGVFNVARMTQPGADTFTARDGLTSDQTHAVFEDREGNIWVGTELGVDMLRPAAVAVEPNIPQNSARGYRLAAREDGTVFVSDSKTLYAIPARGSARIVMQAPSLPAALCAGSGDSLWMPLNQEVFRLSPNGVSVFRRPSEAYSYGCAEDREGRLWIPALEKGLNMLAEGRWSHWPVAAGGAPPGNAVRDAQGRAVVLYRGDPKQPPMPFLAVHRGRVGIGEIEGVMAGRTAVFASSARGLARLSADRVQKLGAEAYPWLGSINGLAQTAAGDTWTIGDAGIVRMRTADLDNAFAHPGAPLPHRVFDFRDGLNSYPQKVPGAQVVEGGDGRIWFLTRRNVLAIDPARLTTNPTPPPVAIRSLTAAGRKLRDPTGTVVLPAGTKALAIGYAAGSLSVPSRVRFRFQLEGLNETWIDADAQRAAFFNDLGPGHYRFRVTAANEDGVWNTEGSALSITIPPTLLETWWFRLLAAAAVGLALWMLYSLRLRRVARNIRERLEERTAERERIARELHDTLLQGVQGLILRFQAAAERVPERHPARAAIEAALERAEAVLVEGRDRVRDLRSPDGRRLDAILQELVEQQPFAPAVDVAVGSLGLPRELAPRVVDETVRIVGEALFNTARHAQAGQVRVLVAYHASGLRVVVRDDGRGFDADTPPRSEQEGHYGLAGMRERARRMGATLALESQPGAGASVTLNVPASVAYALRPRDWLRRIFGESGSARA